MTICQQITLDFDDEMESTRKLLERVPLDDAHRDYKPHEKSMSLVHLAGHVAELPTWFNVVFDSEVFVLMPGEFKPYLPASTEELLAAFDKNVGRGRARLLAATDEEMQRTWAFKFGEHVAFTNVRTRVVRSFINHLVHHRAQLGVYLRLNNIAIPGMYGPSSDEM